MKEIIHQFAGVLLTILVATVLAGILHGVKNDLGEYGLKGALKAQIVSEEKEIEGEMAAASKRYAERKKPTIQYNTNKKLYAGEAYALNDYFLAEDAEGNPVSVTILRVRDENGQIYRNKEGNTFRFSRAGMYVVTVKAKDKEQVSQVHDIAIAVDASL